MTCQANLITKDKNKETTPCPGAKSIRSFGHFHVDPCFQANVRSYKYDFGFSSENAFLFAAAFVSLVAPILWHSQAFPNQLVVGTIVNALLAGSALYLSFRKAILVILLPAIAALLSGFIFGTYSVSLVYFLPVIWLGNAVYVYAIKSMVFVRSANYAIAVLVSSVLKSALIGASAFMLVVAGIVPAVMLIPMSLVQFATAVGGGILAGTTMYFKK